MESARGRRVGCLERSAPPLQRERLLRGRGGIAQASNIGVIAPARSGQRRPNAPREMQTDHCAARAPYADPEPVPNSREVREVGDETRGCARRSGENERLTGRVWRSQLEVRGAAYPK